MGVDLAWAVLGLGILVLAGDLLVRGAVAASLRLGIPALIVSLTVVALGTSAPELLIAVLAVLDGVPGLALGNVVGSNTANVLLVLGLPALISGIRTDAVDTRRSYLLMLGASVLFIAICFAGPIRWPHSLVLLGALALWLGDSLADAKRARAVAEVPAAGTIEGVEPKLPWWAILSLMAAGLVGLPLGANVLIDAASNIARTFGISEALIGLTLVAVGTSMPELATSVMAAIKGRADVALGNIIGSNMFNTLGIIGVAGLVGPLPVPPELLAFDLWVMLAASLVLWPVVFRGWPLGRVAGAALTGAYAVYVVALLV